MGWALIIMGFLLALGGILVSLTGIGACIGIPCVCMGIPLEIVGIIVLRQQQMEALKKSIRDGIIQGMKTPEPRSGESRFVSVPIQDQKGTSKGNEPSPISSVAPSAESIPVDITYASGQKTSTMALISLISGIAAWTIVPILGGIIAVITGHLARKEIASSGGQLAGNNQATAGLVLGYVHLGVAFLCILTFMALAVLGPLWSIFAESFRQLR